MKATAKIKLTIFNLILTVLLTLISAYTALAQVSLVMVVTLVAGSFGAGAFVVNAVYLIRQEKQKQKTPLHP